MTLDGGSLGSGIDEERSKVRETMRTAELMEHRYLERKWRPSFTARATSDWGSVEILESSILVAGRVSLKRCSTVRPRTRALTLGNDRSVRVSVLGDRSSLDASSPMTQMKIAVRLCDRARVGGECPKTWAAKQQVLELRVLDLRAWGMVPESAREKAGIGLPLLIKRFAGRAESSGAKALHDSRPAARTIRTRRFRSPVRVSTPKQTVASA